MPTKRPPGYYEDQYERYHSTPTYKKRRAAANKARRIMTEKHGAAAVRGKDVDHKRPLAKGGGTTEENLRIRARSANRASRKKR